MFRLLSIAEYKLQNLEDKIINISDYFIKSALVTQIHFYKIFIRNGILYINILISVKDISVSSRNILFTINNPYRPKYIGGIYMYTRYDIGIGRISYDYESGNVTLDSTIGVSASSGWIGINTSYDINI